jgi:Ca2+:H+ antiporter
MQHGPLISMKIGIIWLFVITLCISAMSDILVGTIDGFAERMNLSQVFTSMVIVPFFSNVAEQVSAFLFAYCNEMDLCVGVTIGSAIQIATFVLPGSVLIRTFMDIHSYETAWLFFCTVVVAAVLQGGTTNWLVSAMLVGIYIMFAEGIWFHEIENLTFNASSM